MLPLWPANCDYIFILMFSLFSVLVSSFIFFLSLILISQDLNVAKLSSYECGFEPYSDARFSFDIRFYLVAILFLIFDVELSYLFPWAVTLNVTATFSLLSTVSFILLLTIGFVYEWTKGALDWE